MINNGFVDTCIVSGNFCAVRSDKVGTKAKHTTVLGMRLFDIEVVRGGEE